MATTTTTSTTTATSTLSRLTTLLGSQGVQLGKLAILSPGAVSIVTPNIAAIVTRQAILVNRGKNVRLVMASSINPLTSSTTVNGQTWGPVTLAPGMMTLLPAPAAGLAWFVVDISRRELRDLAWAGWITVGFAMFGAGAGVYFTVKDIREHIQKRRATGRSR